MRARLSMFSATRSHAWSIASRSLNARDQLKIDYVGGSARLGGANFYAWSLSSGKHS